MGAHSLNQIPAPDLTPPPAAQENPGLSRREIITSAAVGLAAAGALCAGGWKLVDYLSRHSELPQTDHSPEGSGQPLVVPPEVDRTRELDFIRQGQWRFMPGTELDGKSLKVIGTGLALRPLVGTDVYAKASAFIPNPPINTYGTQLETPGGNFVIAANVSDVKPGQEATVSLHSAPDLVFDERREPFASLSVTIKADSLVVSSWGDNNKPRASQEIPLDKLATGAAFWVKQQGQQLVVGCGNKQVSFEGNLCQSAGQVWFGLDGTTGSSFKLDNLRAYPINGGELRLVDTSKLELGKPDPNGLQAIAAQRRPDLAIGTALQESVVAHYPSMAELVGSQVGALKPEIDGKMQAILPDGPDANGNITEKDFVWEGLDAFVDLARRNGKKISMHTLIFGEAMSAQTEKFLQDVAEKRIPVQAAEEFMSDYIRIVVSRYKDAVDAWDVGNEVLADYSDTPGQGFDLAAGRVYRENAWYKAFGGIRYVGLACKAAKEAGAKKVYINEFGAETDDDRAKVLLDLALPLHQQGYLDGVGLQAHFDDGDIDTWRDDNGVLQESYVFDDMTARFRQFDSLEVSISELSIDNADPHVQAVVSAGLMRAAVHSPNVKSVFWWGLVNGPFYMTSENGQLGNDAPWDWRDGQTVMKETVVGIKAGLRA